MAGPGGGPPTTPRTLVTASGGRPRPPWWRTWRGTALVVGAAVIAGVLTFVLTNQKSGRTTEAAPQVALQPVAASGPDPFTGSVALETTTPSAGLPVSGAASASASSGAGRTVTGSAPGLYGGSRQNTSCDVPKLADFLNSNPAKGRAWASVEGIDSSGISAYLRSLTPVVLRADTRVTNHGFSNGVATPFQSVLQAGTAVLVDSRGLPRVRCACGNPLLPPAALRTAPAFTGTAWPSFKERDVVVVVPAPRPTDRIVVVDPSNGESFSTPVGGSSGSATASPSTSTSAKHPSNSASNSASNSESSGSSPASGSPSGESGSPSSQSVSRGVTAAPDSSGFGES